MLFFSCGPQNAKPDLDGLDPEIQIRRLEMDLFALDLDNIPDELPRIKEKYGDFFDIFNHLIIRIGGSGSPAYSGHLQRFLTDFDVYRLYSEVEKVFPDTDRIEYELEKAFKHFMYYFPEYPVPRVYTFISGFNQSVVTADSILAIGLDKYLGSDNLLYKQLQLTNYQRAKMYPEKIPSDCIIGWAMTEFEFDGIEDNLLNHMLYHGKLLYFADAMLPDHHDSLKTGFSKSQLEWCIRNERQMWTYLVENKLLFSTDARTIARFINDGPFTSEFSRESPSRAAVWLGRQIVKSYMDRHGDVTIEELMLETDYQQILNSARYRP